MLASEIAPFADHHIDKLEKLRETLLSTPDLHFPDMEESLDDLRSAINAFNRFKICMADEHRMKDLAQRQARLCRLHHQQD